MSEIEPRRPAFTLRFHNEATHRTLRLTAHTLGVSMNELAEAAIERELLFLGADLEKKLKRTADLLRSYRDDEVESDIQAFAKAEITEDDPLQSRQATLEDCYGIGAFFARSLER